MTINTFDTKIISLKFSWNCNQPVGNRTRRRKKKGLIETRRGREEGLKMVASRGGRRGRITRVHDAARMKMVGHDWPVFAVGPR